jgi:hypothetical protein
LTRLKKIALGALATLALSGGAALAADEMCGCCKKKPGAAMSCCDKMKDEAAKPADASTPQPAPDHQH